MEEFGKDEGGRRQVEQKTTQRTTEMREGTRDDERGLYWGGFPRKAKIGTMMNLVMTSWEGVGF